MGEKRQGTASQVCAERQAVMGGLSNNYSVCRTHDRMGHLIMHFHVYIFLFKVQVPSFTSQILNHLGLEEFWSLFESFLGSLLCKEPRHSLL